MSSPSSLETCNPWEGQRWEVYLDTFIRTRYPSFVFYSFQTNFQILQIYLIAFFSGTKTLPFLRYLPGWNIKIPTIKRISVCFLFHINTKTFFNRRESGAPWDMGHSKTSWIDNKEMNMSDLRLCVYLKRTFQRTIKTCEGEIKTNFNFLFTSTRFLFKGRIYYVLLFRRHKHTLLYQ